MGEHIVDPRELEDYEQLLDGNKELADKVRDLKSQVEALTLNNEHHKKRLDKYDEHEIDEHVQFDRFKALKAHKGPNRDWVFKRVVTLRSELERATSANTDLMRHCKALDKKIEGLMIMFTKIAAGTARVKISEDGLTVHIQELNPEPELVEEPA